MPPLRTLRRFAKAQSTVAHWLGFGAKPYGFYVPYRHADRARALAESDEVAWVREWFDRECPRFESFLRDAARFNGRLDRFRKADPASPSTPRFDQDWFPGLDGAAAYAMVRLRRPSRIVEVGSGHSTRFLAQAVRDEGLRASLHSIDPRPRREIDALCDSVSREPLDRVERARFEALEAGDILFIDSSHVALPGTDVDFLVGEVLPLLRPGVLVHVHDIFLPNGYPRAWRRRGYNEQNVLLALLSGGVRFQVVLPNAYLRRHRPDLASLLFAPSPASAREASLWLEVREPGRGRA